MQFLAHQGLLENGLKVRPLVMPDLFMDQAKREAMYMHAQLDRKGIVDSVFAALGTTNTLSESQTQA